MRTFIVSLACASGVFLIFGLIFLALTRGENPKVYDEIDSILGKEDDREDI